MTELVTDYLTITLLFVALGIFGGLAIKSHSMRTFQFQISIFIIIWLVGEIADIILSIYKIDHGIEDLGTQIHFAAMVLFAILLWTRFYFSKRAEKKIIGDSSDYYTT